ncbi:SNW/SKI-interacting protein A-like protein [Tanacetum coccineum]
MEKIRRFNPPIKCIGNIDYTFTQRAAITQTVSVLIFTELLGQAVSASKSITRQYDDVLPDGDDKSVGMSMKELRMEIDDQTIIASSFVFPILKVSICYKPSQQSTALNLGANERIIRMMEMHVDTLELPKSKHKHVQKANGSPPVLVMHSPPRPVTVQNNANFAKISEALYVVEQKAREAVATRSKLQKDLMMKEKERKEQELHALAQKARSERVGPGGTVGAGTGSYTPFKKNMMDTDEPMRIEREHEHEHEHKSVKDQDQPRESKAEREDWMKRENHSNKPKKETENVWRRNEGARSYVRLGSEKQDPRGVRLVDTLLESCTDQPKKESKAEREDRMKREKTHKERRREREKGEKFEAKDAAMRKKQIQRKLIRNEKVRGNKNKGWKLWRSPSAGCGLSVSSSTKGARMEMEGGCRLRVRVIWKCRLVLMWLLWLELSPKHFMAIKKE